MAALGEAYGTYCRDGFGKILARWESLERTTGSEVAVALDGETVGGVAEGVDSDGSLLVRVAVGEVRRIAAASLIVEQHHTSEEVTDDDRSS